MSILQEILTWSKTIPAWQSDAIARLLAKQTLDAADVDDLLALLKSAHGTPIRRGALQNRSPQTRFRYLYRKRPMWRSSR